MTSRVVLLATVTALAAPATSGVASRASSVPEVQRPSLSQEFVRYGTSGSMVVLQSGRFDRLVVVGANRSRFRDLPSSTFKIPNALIGLDRRLVKSPGDVLEDSHPDYELDGKPLLPIGCEATLTFRAAFQQSCIPIFQALARRVGRPAYERTLRAMDYGNGRLDGTSVDDFWLHRPFGISPREQVTFLERLRTGRLPVRRDAVRAVQDMLVLEREDGVTLRGKTGFVFAQKGRPQRGWWVGWVSRPGQVSVFALHMDMTRPELIPRRVTIGRAILRKLHAFGR